MNRPQQRTRAEANNAALRKGTASAIPKKFGGEPGFSPEVGFYYGSDQSIPVQPIRRREIFRKIPGSIP